MKINNNIVRAFCLTIALPFHLYSGSGSGPVAEGDSVALTAAGITPDSPEGDCCNGDGSWEEDGDPTFEWEGDFSGSAGSQEVEWDTSLENSDEKEQKEATVTVTQNWKCSDSRDSSTRETTKEETFSLEVWPTCGEEMYDPDEFCCDSTGESSSEPISREPGQPCVPPAKTGTTAPSVVPLSAVTTAKSIIVNNGPVRSVGSNLYEQDKLEIEVGSGAISNIMQHYGPWQRDTNCSDRITGCGDGLHTTCSPSSVSVQVSDAADVVLNLTGLISNALAATVVNLIGTLATTYGMSAPDSVAYNQDPFAFQDHYLDVYVRAQTIENGGISGQVRTRTFTVTFTAPLIFSPGSIVSTSAPSNWSVTQLNNHSVPLTNPGRKMQGEVVRCHIPCCSNTES